LIDFKNKNLAKIHYDMKIHFGMEIKMEMEWKRLANSSKNSENCQNRRFPF
jgi:hypothetical protein